MWFLLPSCPTELAPRPSLYSRPYRPFSQTPTEHSPTPSPASGWGLEATWWCVRSVHNGGKVCILVCFLLDPMVQGSCS